MIDMPPPNGGPVEGKVVTEVKDDASPCSRAGEKVAGSWGVAFDDSGDVAINIHPDKFPDDYFLFSQRQTVLLLRTITANLQRAFNHKAQLIVLPTEYQELKV